MVPVTRRDGLGLLASGIAVATWPGLAWPGLAQAQPGGKLQSWKLATSTRTGIHDLAPAPDGGIWFTAQASGHLGWLDPRTGRTDLIALGSGSSPHGVIQGPDKAAWITDGGQNAIARVGWPDRQVQLFPAAQGHAVCQPQYLRLRRRQRDFHPPCDAAGASQYPPDPGPPRRGMVARERNRTCHGDSQGLSSRPFDPGNGCAAQHKLHRGPGRTRQAAQNDSVSTSPDDCAL